jgi:phage RecT family recombinase
MQQQPDQSRALTFSKPGDLMRFLETGKGAIAAALPKHLNPDRMLRLALTAFSTTPALRQCTGQSILASIVVASQLGLEPGVSGQGYLIPYKQTCTFVPGWQGLVGMLNNTGRATVWTGAVFDGDEFDYQLGAHPNLVHRPGPNFGDPDALEWVYACGKVNGSEQPVIEAWPIARVWKHRDKNNKVGNAHYSFKHPEMYARKVVLLQVLKYMPRSIELNNAIVATDSAEMNIPVKVEGGIIEAMPGDIEVETSEPNMDSPRTTAQPPKDSPRRKSATATSLFGSDTARTATEVIKSQEKASAAQGLRNLCKASHVTEAQLLAFVNRETPPEKHITRLDDVYEPTLRELADNWLDLLPQINPDTPPL